METVAPTTTDAARRAQLRRRAAVALNVLLAVVVAAEVVVFGNLVYGRWDLTENATFSLSPRSANILAALDEDVRVTVLYGKQYPGHAWTWQRVADLLEEMEGHSDRIETVFVDPFRNPAEVQALRQKYGISPNDLNDGVVVFESGEKNVIVTDASIVEYAAGADSAGPDKIRGRKTFLGEDAFLSALLNLTQGVKPVVYVLAGHGEAEIEDDQTELGFAFPAQILKVDGFDVRPFRFGGATASVPVDADLVIVPYPKSPLPSDEAHALRRFAEEGGKLFLLAHLHFREGEAAPLDMNLDPVLDLFGVELGGKLLLDDELRGRREILTALQIRRYDPEHPATRAMGAGDEKPSIFMFAQAVLPKADTARPVAVTSDTVVEKKDIADFWDRDRYEDLLRKGSLYVEGRDRRGPFPVVVASEIPGKRPELTARAVVVGTQTAVSNVGVSTPFFNKDLFLNLVNWLTKRESRIGIASKRPREVFYTVRPSTRRLVFVLVLVVMPLIALACGWGAWMFRRR